VVFSAPSGTGKSTIVRELLRRNRKFCQSVSATTRPRRRGERNGRDYFFLTAEQFRNKAQRCEFIETVEVFDGFYGTPKDFVLRAVAGGKTVLFDIDVKGGMAIRKWRKDAVLIFLAPPGLAALKRRLRGRKSESEASLKLRLSRALKEIRYWSKYDYVVCNDKLAETVQLIEMIIRAESQRSTRIQAADLDF
jgi:guanylate kinase